MRRRSGGHPSHSSLRLDFTLPERRSGHYAIRVGAKTDGAYEVQSEECSIRSGLLREEHHFHVASGAVRRASFTPAPVSLPDRLYLVAAAGLPQFRPVYDALSRIEIYNLSPRSIADLQDPDPSSILRRDGSNASSVLQRLAEPARERVNDYLARIVPGISDPQAKTIGKKETIEFRQLVEGRASPWRFLASSMSDGTEVRPTLSPAA